MMSIQPGGVLYTVGGFPVLSTARFVVPVELPWPPGVVFAGVFPWLPVVALVGGLPWPPGVALPGGLPWPPGVSGGFGYGGGGGS